MVMALKTGAMPVPRNISLLNIVKEDNQYHHKPVMLEQLGPSRNKHYDWDVPSIPSSDKLPSGVKFIHPLKEKVSSGL